MNENEKNLFYQVLKEKIKENPPPELTSNIMHIIHKKVKKKTTTIKILEILGYSLLITIPVVFLGLYLYFYTDFKLPVLQFSFTMPSKVYMITIFMIFAFSMIQLYFRKRLYESN
jgi:ABC-type proline/glycine betaine transport system permease subunit